MTCYEDTEDDKNGNGDDENKQDAKTLDVMKEKWVLEHPESLKNPKEPH